jgi:hypothetical protein
VTSYVTHVIIILAMFKTFSISYTFIDIFFGQEHPKTEASRLTIQLDK